jgi:hypothetical protein
MLRRYHCALLRHTAYHRTHAVHICPCAYHCAALLVSAQGAPLFSAGAAAHSGTQAKVSAVGSYLLFRGRTRAHTAAPHTHCTFSRAVSTSSEGCAVHSLSSSSSSATLKWSCQGGAEVSAAPFRFPMGAVGGTSLACACQKPSTMGYWPSAPLTIGPGASLTTKRNGWCANVRSRVDQPRGPPQSE